MPNHVAVIMDRNRRWAQMREAVWAWGFEDSRGLVPQVEDQGSHALCFIIRELESSQERMFVFLLSGTALIKFPKPLQVLLSEVVETTKNNSQLHLILAVNYSGQNDIVQARQNIVLKVKDGLIEPKDIDEPLLETELGTKRAEFPDTDLLIRSSGELRISNFLLWLLAYTELYFANSLWPDFGEDEFVKALSSLLQRQRRYGGRSS